MSTALKLGAAVTLAMSLAACTTAPTGPESLPYTGSNLTPTEQFGIDVAAIPDKIQLAPKPGALSPAQVGALMELARRYRIDGRGPMTIETPVGSANAAIAQQAANAAHRVLIDNGVSIAQVELSSYPAVGAPAATVAVGFTRYQVNIPDCSKYHADVTKTLSNEPTRAFGCAVTANFAAQIANPGDLITPREMGPSDGARRAVVLGKYRQGLPTATERSAEERGVVSEAVQ